MQISLTEQIWIFFLALLLGIVLSCLYDVFTFIKMIAKFSKIQNSICDIIYFIVSAIVVFMFMLIVNFGKIRVFPLVGLGIGWYLYHCMIGKKVINTIGKALKFIVGVTSRYKQAINKFMINIKLKVKIVCARNVKLNFFKINREKNK